MTRHARGFILIYVVAMVAALAMILLQLQQRQSIPRQTEREVGNALQKEEGSRLLDFVLAGTREQALDVDPRFMQFRRLMSEDPTRLSEIEEALAQLKALLDQMGFHIGSGRGAGGTALATKHDGESILFGARVEGYKVQLGERSYTVRIIPGNALPNLNALPYDSLWRTLRHLGLPEEEARELAANLIDWRDADAFRTDSRGAEQEYYRSQQPPYSPRNGPIAHWQELAYVKGVTTDRLPLLRDNFVIGPPWQGRVFVDTSSPELLAAISGVKLDAINGLLAAYGKLPQKDGRTPPDVAELNLSADEIEAFDRTAAWQPETSRLRIEIIGPDVSLRADYDAKNQKLLARW